MKLHRYFLLLTLSLTLTLTSCSSGLTEEDVTTVETVSNQWAKALNDKEWNSMVELYAGEVDFNGQKASARSVLETKKKFFAEKGDYEPLVGAWVKDTMHDDQIEGHFEVIGRWHDYKDYTRTRVDLVWQLNEEGQFRIIAQKDAFGADAGKLARAFRQSWIGDAHFDEHGRPNFEWWRKRAAELPKKYAEHLLFFAEHEGKPYFWYTDSSTNDFMTGIWMNCIRCGDGADFKMGLIDGEGKVLIPAKFDYIGNIGAIYPNTVEVQLGKEKGLYRIDGTEILEPTATSIRPVYDDPWGRIAFVEIDYGTEGEAFWIDANGKEWQADPADSLQAAVPYHLSQADYLLHLPWQTKLNPNSEEFSTVALGGLDRWGYQWGIFISPTFLKQTGLVDEFFMDNQNNTSERGSSMAVDSVIEFDNGSIGIFAVFEDWGVGGREEWHNREHQYLTIGPEDEAIKKSEPLAVYDVEYNLCTSGDFRYLDDGMVEAQKTEKKGDYWNYPVYTYHKIDSSTGNLQPIEDNREYPFTRYVEVDTSYFKHCISRRPSKEEALANDPGEDEYWKDAAENGAIYVNARHLPLEDLDLMVNEIYAEYGYAFKKKKWQDYFSGKSWYNPRYDNVDSLLTPMDSLNIHYIRNYQASLAGNEADVLKEEYQMDEMW